MSLYYNLPSALLYCGGFALMVRTLAWSLNYEDASDEGDTSGDASDEEDGSDEMSSEHGSSDETDPIAKLKFVFFEYIRSLDESLSADIEALTQLYVERKISDIEFVDQFFDRFAAFVRNNTQPPALGSTIEVEKLQPPGLNSKPADANPSYKKLDDLGKPKDDIRQAGEFHRPDFQHLVGKKYTEALEEASKNGYHLYIVGINNTKMDPSVAHPSICVIIEDKEYDYYTNSPSELAIIREIVDQ